jgi:myo-inositol 2-dehydrogenase/D-chiro-inositol 1-dehydrogenase
VRKIRPKRDKKTKSQLGLGKEIKMTFRLGIIGAGRIGRIHCDNILSLHKKAELLAICDPRLDHTLVTNKSISHLFTQEDDFFCQNLDAVIIASPTPCHKRQIEKAIERRWHILCEKPLDLTLDSHLEIRDLLSKNQVKFQIGFNRRFDNDFAKIADYQKTGKLGRPYYVRITSRDPGLPSMEYLSSSGGMFLDMSIHDFDMARFIMNSDISEIFARGGVLTDNRLLEIDDIDTAIITLKFDNGTFGVIDNSRSATYGYDQRVELFGSQGSLANNNHHTTTVELCDEKGTHQEPLLDFFLERYQLSYAAELSAFIDSCINNKAPMPDISDAIHAISAAIAAKESLRLHQPVKVLKP